MIQNNPEIDFGSKAPEFHLPDQYSNERRLAEFQGRWLVLYFYPKDNTSGCTIEAVGFSERLPDFQRLNTEVIGVSPDSVTSHCSFMDKHRLQLILLSDTEHRVLQAYGVWGKKQLYGREYMGVIRSTFLIDPAGTVRAVWRNVKLKDHVEAVYQRVKELTAVQ